MNSIRRVYTSPTLLMAGFVRTILENAGITCILKNYFLSGASGDLPLNETWPEVWVAERDVECAQSIIQATLTANIQQPDWVCPCCQESIEGQFQNCWNCGRLHP